MRDIATVQKSFLVTRVWDHKNDFCTVAMCLVPCKQSKSETSCTMLQPCQMTNLDDCTYHLPGCPVTRWPETV